VAVPLLEGILVRSPAGGCPESSSAITTPRSEAMVWGSGSLFLRRCPPSSSCAKEAKGEEQRRSITLESLVWKVCSRKMQELFMRSKASDSSLELRLSRLLRCPATSQAILIRRSHRMAFEWSKKLRREPCRGRGWATRKSPCLFSLVCNTGYRNGRFRLSMFPGRRGQGEQK